MRAAQRPGWWTGYDDEVIEGLDAHLAYEVDAAVARVYTIPFAPGAAADARLRPGGLPGHGAPVRPEIRQLLAVRLRRQEALRNREGLSRSG